MKRLLSAVFLSQALVFATSSVTAWATDSLVTRKACAPNQLYLENSLTPKPDPAYCPDCKRNTAEQFFGIHGLAQNIKDVKNKSDAGRAPDPWSHQPLLPQQCFTSVMSLRPRGRSYHYAACASENSQAGPSQVPPCDSPALSSSIETAFQQTMNCMGIDEKEVFALFGWDSHFQMNLWNHGGVGTGQLTSIAIADVDINRRFAHDLGKPECKQFEGIFEKSSERYRTLAKAHGHYPVIQPCEWMAPPENPSKNLLYAAATYRMDKRSAEKLAKEIGAQPDDVEKIATNLARYMYNGGLGGVRNVFRLFRLRTGKQRMSFSQFKSAFSNYLGTHYEEADEKTKSRVAAYAHHVDQLKKQVEHITGDAACSD